MAVIQNKQIDELIYNQSLMFIEIGKSLKAIRDGNLYESLDYDTFNSYLASKGMPISTGYAYIHIFEVYILGLNYSKEDIAEIPWYKLQLIAPKVRGKEKKTADEWLHKAKALSPQDLRTDIAEEKANKGHEDKLLYPEFYRCDVCGKWKIQKDLKICTGKHEIKN